MSTEYCAEIECNKMSEIYNGFKACSASKTTVDDIINCFNETCEKIKTVIKDFYSDSCGQGQEIKNMYAKLHDYSFNRPKFSYTDLNLISHKYNAYLTGMKEFIQKVASNERQSSAEDLESYQDKDRIFIHNTVTDPTGIFRISNVDIRDAFNNLEVLIDELGKFDDKYKSFNDFGSTDISYRLALLYTNSIIHYFTELMCEEFKCFCEMKKALDGKSPVAEILKKPEVKKPEFQVF